MNFSYKQLKFKTGYIYGLNIARRHVFFSLSSRYVLLIALAIIRTLSGLWQVIRCRYKQTRCFWIYGLNWKYCVVTGDGQPNINRRKSAAAILTTGRHQKFTHRVHLESTPFPWNNNGSYHYGITVAEPFIVTSIENNNILFEYL